jgi:hypothetical protein
MLLSIRKRWCIALVAATIVATLGGMVVSAVQKVRTAAMRTSDL